MSAAAAPVSDLGTRHGSSMLLAGPAAPNFFQPASAALPGSRSRTDGAGGPQSNGACPGSVVRAARGRSTAPTRSSRAALTAHASHHRPFAPTAAARMARVDLIEQSTRAGGDGFPSRSSSTRPAGNRPAVLTTQGETL